eukprot:jgi/Galph1/2919/GphlegSOOS_G1560.1
MTTESLKSSYLPLSCIIPRQEIKKLVHQWLKEDIPSFDFAAAAAGLEETTATLYAKSEGTFAGKPFFEAIFQELECQVHWLEGVSEEGTIWFDSLPVAIATIHGAAKNILQGERTSLNVLARCSGIATHARQLVSIAAEHGWPGRIAGTRKTTPGFRLVEKYGMLLGGADTHRMDLSSMVMLKDNHIWSCGSIAKAIEHAQRVSGFSLKIEVECQSFSDACQAAENGADVVMLDNFDATLAKETAHAIRELYPHVIIECSGGIDKHNLAQYFSPDIDIISMSLSQSYRCLDFSLKVGHAKKA